MNSSESKIEKKAVKLVWDYLGIKGVKLTTPGDTGYPDRMFLIPSGKPLFIEFKQPGRRLSVKQALKIKELKSLGYRVEVHDNEVDAFQAVIKAVEPEGLHEEGRKILAGARSRCAVLRSGAGQNSDNSRGVKNLKKKKAVR